MTDMKKVLGVFGSPRRGGNTDLLLEEALKGAAEGGAQVEQVHLSEKKITSCTECLSCFKDGVCIIPDDMQSLYPRLLDADIVIFASPVFFYGVTGWAKAMVDRCQALWARKYVLHDPALDKKRRRKGFFIAVGGTKGQRMFEGAVLTVRYFFDAFDTAYTGDLLFRGVDAGGDILKTPDALTQAFTAGSKLVSDLHHIEGTSDK
jgi:multimeric flavodoxin WrbA